MNVEMKTVPAMDVVTVRYRGRYDEMGSRIGLLFRFCGRWVGGPVFALYRDPEYREDDADIEVCLPLKGQSAEKARRSVERFLKGSLSACPDDSREAEMESGDRIAIRNVPQATVLSIVHVGGYDTIGEGYRKIGDEMARREIRSTPPSRELYLKGPGMVFRGNPAKYRTEIQMPVE